MKKKTSLSAAEVVTNLKGKATKGPWRVYDNGPDLGDFAIRDQDKEEVAIVRFNAADWEANARLIAAAPELLDDERKNYNALHSIISILNNYRTSSDFSARLDSWFTAYAYRDDEISALIAKVEGR